jgi:menaquinone-9 beta-reductase
VKPVVIVGGGVAGLALGIGLRQKGVSVTLFEAGDYPRHRVCGEFISGRGQQTLERLGLLPALRDAGAQVLSTIAFYSERNCHLRRVLPNSALGISRWSLDATLAATFEMLGGDLRRNTSWRGNFSAPGVVRATGRDRTQARQANKWFGMKAHAHGVRLEADLEMHFLKAGYIGLCRLPGGLTNVCGLFWSTMRGSHPRELLRGTPGSIVRERVNNAEWEPNSFCAVGGLPLHAPFYRGAEARVGDAVAMTPPLTGNGMSFGLETAELACGPFKEFAEDRFAWQAAVDQVWHLYRRQFGRRIVCANSLHRLLLTTGSFGLWLGGGRHAWRLCFGATR